MLSRWRKVSAGFNNALRVYYSNSFIILFIVECGKVSYTYVECLVLKSKVLNQLGRGEESLEATRTVCQLVVELKKS